MAATPPLADRKCDGQEAIYPLDLTRSDDGLVTSLPGDHCYCFFICIYFFNFSIYTH